MIYTNLMEYYMCPYDVPEKYFAPVPSIFYYC